MLPLKPKILCIYYPFYIYYRKSYRFVIVEVKLFTYFLLRISEIVPKNSVKDNRNISPKQFSYSTCSYVKVSSIKKLSSTRIMHYVK